MRTPGRNRRGLRNGAKDNLNLDFVHVFVAQFDDLLKSFLPNLRLSLSKSQVLALDDRTSYRPGPRVITLDTFLERNIKKDDHAGNLKPLGQFKVFPAVGSRQRRRVNHAEAIQAQPQFREVVDESEGLGLKTLIPLVVAHAPSRPVRRDDLCRAEVALRKSRLPAGCGSTEQNNRRTNQSHSLLFAFVWCWFLCHVSNDGST